MGDDVVYQLWIHTYNQNGLLVFKFYLNSFKRVNGIY